MCGCLTVYVFAMNLFSPQGIPDCFSSKHCFHSDNGEEEGSEEVTARVIRQRMSERECVCVNPKK